MFGTQALRLLRETWPNPTTLAQELYAIFDDTNPVSSGPIAISPPPPPPSIPGMTPENFAFPPWTPLTFGDGSGQTQFQVAPGGGLTISSPSLSFTTPDGQKQQVGGGASSFPGQVQSGGPGQGPYSVNVYQEGLDGPSVVMDVMQLQIDDSDSIPAGTWVIVAVTDAGSFMQVPVWLEDLS